MSDKEDYISFIDQNSDVPIFFQPWWLDSVSEGNAWDVVLARNANKGIDGVFVYQIKPRVLGLKSIHIPVLTPYLGLWFFSPQGNLKKNTLYSFHKKVIQTLLEQIPSHVYLNINLHPSIQNTLPFNWSGYNSEVKYTYILSLEKEEQQLYKELKGSVRTDIKKAEKLLTIKETHDAQKFYDINSLSFSRQDMLMPYSFVCINSLFVEASKREQLMCLEANDIEGNTHAQILIIRDLNTSYLLAIGADEKFRNSGAVSLLIWTAIKRSIAASKFFDFEGGNIKSIEKVFRAFGGTLTPYVSLKHTPNLFYRSILALLGKI